MAKFSCNSILCSFLIVILVAYFVEAENRCTQENACLCRFNQYKKIDLSTLIPDKTDTLVFQKGNLTYYFHGCVDGVHKTPENVTVPYSLLIEQVYSQQEGNKTINKYNHTAYTSKQIKFVPDGSDPNDYKIVYVNGSTVVATVHLVCDHFSVNFLNIISGNTTELALISPLACVVTNHPGLSTGSVLLILFFTGFGIYLIGGMLYLYYMRGARGVEVIPNVDFWRGLPGLVKDGLVFLLSGCRPTFISTAESYDRI